MNEKQPIVCIACSMTLKGAPGNDFQPMGGLAFVSYGHYGTTFFDPMDGTSIEIAVCDECLQKAEEMKRIRHNSNRNMAYSWT